MTRVFDYVISIMYAITSAVMDRQLLVLYLREIHAYSTLRPVSI